MTPADVQAMPVGAVEEFARWQRRYQKKQEKQAKR